MNKLVSIIIPVYNVEKYLHKCLESVTNQTYKNIEIIIVNDGSTDSSKNICEKFQKSDRRIRLINKSNEGLSLARKAGFVEAKGEYVLFIDSDDFINKEYIENMFLNKEDNADIIISKIVYSYNSYEDEIKTTLCDKKNYTSKDILIKMLLNKEVKDFAWGKLFKKDLIKEEYFTNSRVFEDIEFTHRVVLNAKTIAYSNNSIYYYVQRENSLLSSTFNESKLYLIEVTEFMINNIVKRYPELKTEAEYRYIVSSLMIIIPIIRTRLDKSPIYEDYYKKYTFVLKNLSIRNKFIEDKYKIYMILNKLNCLNFVYKFIVR